MEARGWYIIKLHGGKYQSGLPDLFAMHPEYGTRWIETKTPSGKLRASQVKKFYLMSRAKVKIFVLEDETHYRRLFEENDNWTDYT